MKREKSKHAYSKKKNKSLLIILLLFFIALFIYSSIKIIIWFKDTQLITNEVSDIENIVEITEQTDETNETEIIESDENKSNPYWNYIQMNLMDVNFSELKNINSDVKGWIQINGTSVNYPFVQTSDNSYYLNHSITKQNNSAGWVFLDYRNNAENFDRNTILYAHARVNQYMFGSLKNTLKSNWLNDTSNHIIKLSTQNQNTLWQIFSIYHIPTNNDYIRTQFNGDDDFYEFANMLKNRSIYNFNTKVKETDKILTLSTCYGNNEKLVVHAKLIKYSNK